MKFEGTVGKYPVTLYLYPEADQETEIGNYAGLYYYDSQLIPLELFYSVEDKHTELRLDHWGSGGFESFHGSLKDATFTGTWEKDERSLPFSLTAVPLAKYEIPMQYYEAALEVPLGEEYEGEEIKGISELFYLLPKDEEIQSALMQTLMKNYTDFESYKQMVFREFIEEYMHLDKWVKEKEFEPDYWMNFESLKRGMPQLETEKWLTMGFYLYAYTGGAHGNYAQLYSIWDKEKQRILEPNDVWDAKYDEEISELILQSAKKEYEIPEGEYLASGDIWTPFFSDEIPITSNFTLAKNGIIFHYNPYEIAAYAAGIVSLFVSYESLKPYLNPDFSF